MFSAISFGVFCRLAPSTRRDHPVDERLARLGGDLHDDPVGQHRGAAGDRGAVAAGFADDRGGLAGDRRLVDRGDALDDVAVAGDDLPGLDHDEVAERSAAVPGTAPRRGSGRRRASSRSAAGPRSRAWSAAASRPAPCRGPRPPPRPGWRTPRSATARPRSSRRRPTSWMIAEYSGQQRADLDDEHDRVPELDPRVQLLERVRQSTSTASCGSSSPPPTRRPRGRGRDGRRHGAGNGTAGVGRRHGFRRM